VALWKGRKGGRDKREGGREGGEGGREEGKGRIRQQRKEGGGGKIKRGTYPTTSTPLLAGPFLAPPFPKKETESLVEVAFCFRGAMNAWLGKRTASKAVAAKRVEKNFMMVRSVLRCVHGMWA
jgi:hypothetical protein